MTERRCDKGMALDLIILLSALESWAFSTKTHLPDHTLDELNRLTEELREEVMK